MSEGGRLRRGMATDPFGYCTICAHVAPGIPPPLPERREIGAFLPWPGFEPVTLALMSLLERHHLTTPPNTGGFYKLITPCICVGKANEIFCENIKILLFEDEEYKGPIPGNYNIGKI
jgi:hypothetical protein